MNKKTLIIIGVIVGLLIIGVAVFLFTRPEGAGKATEGILFFLFPSSEDKPGPAFPSDGAQPSPADENGIPGTAGLPPKILKQLTNDAVAGATFNNTLKKARYFEKTTGNLYQVNADGQNKEQLSITTIPRIFSVIWLKDGNGAALRYFDTSNETDFGLTKTFLVPSLSTSTKELEGIFLPSNTKDIAVSAEEDKIFYLVGSDSVSGIVASYKNNDQKETFSSPYGDFLASWPKKETVLFVTKPAAAMEGYFYKFDVKNKTLSKILGPIKGLTILSSPSIKTVLYSQSESKSLITKLYDTTKKTSALLNIKTLPEKCIFSLTSTTTVYCAVPKTLPDAEYPDDWYKGNISFMDALWQIDLEKGTTDLILDENDFDMVNLFMNKEENYLFFQNKKDSTLWSLKLSD